MAKRLPRPDRPVRVRLDWDEANQQALDVAAAECGLSVASFARLALELLVSRGKVTLTEVCEEAGRLTAREEPEPEKPAGRGKRKGKGG